MFVADQNGAQQAVIPFSQGQNLGCLLIAILRAAGSCSEDVLLPMPKKQQHDQNDQCGDHKYTTAIVHWRTMTSFFCFWLPVWQRYEYCGYTTHIIGYYSIPSPKAQTLQRLFAQNSRFSQNVCLFGRPLLYLPYKRPPPYSRGLFTQFRKLFLWQRRIIPALRLKHRSGGCGTASALPKCSIIHKVLSALLA